MTLGVKVKMVTGDQLAIAKETGSRLCLGNHMYPAKVLKGGPTPVQDTTEFAPPPASSPELPQNHLPSSTPTWTTSWTSNENTAHPCS